MSTLAASCLNNSVHVYDNNTNGSEMGDEGVMQKTDPYSKELSDQVNHYIMKRGIPIVSALGLLGNFLSLLVLTKEKLHKSLTKMEISAHIGLIGLAVSDLLLCLMVLLVTTLPFQEYYREGQVLIYFDLVSRGFITVFIITSTWLIVVMAAERYVAVCHPLRARNLISLCRTRAYVIVLFLLCPLCTVPIFLENYIVEVQCADGSKVYKVDNVSKDSVMVRRIVWAMCFDFVPCAALVYFNTCLIWKIHKAKQLREKLAPGQCSRSSGTCMHSNSNTIKRFRWDGSNTRSTRAGANGTANSGDNANSPKPNKCLFNFSRGGRGLKKGHDMDLLDSSDSVDQSQSGVDRSLGVLGGGGGVVGGVGVGDLRREMQLLCKQGSNGAVKTSSRLSPNTTPCRNVQCRQHRVLTGRRRFSDNALNSVTATLVAVVLTFLILVSPWEMVKFALEISSSPVDKHKVKIAMYVTNLMQVLNFSFNFVLYCVVNKSFRHTLRNVVCLQPISGDVR